MSKPSYYDITKVIGKRQHFVAKASSIGYARKIAKMVSKEQGVKESRIIAWYRKSDGTKRFKVEEKINGNKK